MPQGPILVRDIIDANSVMNGMTGTAGTVIKAAPGRVINVSVVAVSTATGGIYDCAAAASTAASNKVFSVPATVGLYNLSWPFSTGITVFTGAGMTLSVSLA